PVTLVRTVVARKAAVQAGGRLPRSIAASTTSPVTMPMRLMTTWTSVNVATDMPHIMLPSCRIAPGAGAGLLLRQPHDNRATQMVPLAQGPSPVAHG